jgi:hypothetical protein
MATRRPPAHKRRQTLESLVDHFLNVQRKSFMAFAVQGIETLVAQNKRMAQEAGAEYQHLHRKVRNDKMVNIVFRRCPILEGLVCVLYCMECSPPA